MYVSLILICHYHNSVIWLANTGFSGRNTSEYACKGASSIQLTLLVTLSVMLQKINKDDNIHKSEALKR